MSARGNGGASSAVNATRKFRGSTRAPVLRSTRECMEPALLNATGAIISLTPHPH